MSQGRSADSRLCEYCSSVSYSRELFAGTQTLVVYSGLRVAGSSYNLTSPGILPASNAADAASNLCSIVVFDFSSTSI